ncbi:MAG: MFS transporter [Candidatus Pristimantibacillus sp.]
MSAISSIIFIFIGIFVNLYIWEFEQSIFELSLFNMIMYISWGIAFTTGAALLTRFTIRLLLGLSAASGAIAFLLLTFLHSDVRILWITWIGLFVGGMYGIQSAALNLSVALYGKGKDFAPFFAITGLITQSLTVLVPLMSAIVIQYFGYNSSFALMLVFLTIMLVFSFTMPRIALPQFTADEGSFLKQLSWRNVFARPGSKWLLLSILAGGAFLQFQNLFTLIFTFTITEDKTLIALLNMLYTASSFVGLLLFRKIKLDESKWLWFGTLLLGSGFLIVLMPYKPILIISNLLTTIGMFFFGMIWTAQLFRCIQPLSPGQQAAFLVWRECLLVTMRCVLLSLMLFLDDIRGILFVVIIGITLLCLFSIPIFQKKAMRLLTAPVQES